MNKEESHRNSVRKWKENNKEKQKEYMKKYHNSEKGKQRRKEANARYYAKKKGLVEEDETYYYDPVDREYDEYKDHMLEEEFSKNFQ